MPAQSRNSILVVPRSCRVFHPREPTGTSHQNPIPVPIPIKQGALSEPVTGTARYPFLELLRSQAGCSQPLQNWRPWVGTDLKSLLRQSGNCSAGNQCYSAIVHLFLSKVYKTESAGLTRVSG